MDPLLRQYVSFSQKINYPSADRNKSYILEVLQKEFDESTKANVLEIASGTGQHASYFAQSFPNFIFQPSEYDKSLFESISAYADDTPTNNVKQPLQIDVTQDFSNIGVFDYIINVNMFHITPFKCTIGFFENGSKVLKTGGKIVTYGPYKVNGVLEPASNVQFDAGLRRQNVEWGVRDIKDLKAIAEQYRIMLLRSYDLPSNNKCLVWQKL